jgi:hypothetical protein
MELFTVHVNNWKSVIWTFSYSPVWLLYIQLVALVLTEVNPFHIGCPMGHGLRRWVLYPMLETRPWAPSNLVTWCWIIMTNM